MNMDIDEAVQRAEAILPGVEAPEGEDDPRWQAVIAVAEFIPSHPKRVWDFIQRWGQDPDDDLRMAISTCALEELLAHDFSTFFDRVEELVRQNELFARTFCSCWKLGESDIPENAARFDALKRSL
jgi:hypothetical protein